MHAVSGAWLEGSMLQKKIERRWTPFDLFWCALFICLPNKDKRFHPTQKPVELMEYLIRTYTHPGEVVLDNCIGSGSTAVAAIRSGRHFVGIERDPQYAQIAQERCLEECDKIGIVA